jgi:hypothetical protein
VDKITLNAEKIAIPASEILGFNPENSKERRTT